MNIASISPLFFTYIILTSVYLFPSGMPQPGDLLVVAGVALLFITGSKIKFPDVNTYHFFMSTVSFFVWIIIVSLVNALVSNQLNIINAAIFGIFNLMVVFFSVSVVQSVNGPREFIEKALIASTVIMFLALLVNFSGTSRQTAMFNNPNQLAYFSILMLAALIHVTEKFSLLKPRFMIVATMLVISTFAAASLIGYAALGLLTIAWLLKLGVRKVFFLILISFIFALFLSYANFDLNTSYSLFEIVLSRISILDYKLQGASEVRGYDRIFEFPEYLFFGAGEGGLSRFNIPEFHELHSTFGTLLFSYGIVGLLLFLNILRHVCRGATVIKLILLAAPLVYSITHHGFRFSSFWVFLVILVAIKEKRHDQPLSPGHL